MNDYICMLQQRVETNTYQYFVALDDDLKLYQVSKLGNAFHFFPLKIEFIELGIGKTKRSLESWDAKCGSSCFISSGKRWLLGHPFGSFRLHSKPKVVEAFLANPSRSG